MSEPGAKAPNPLLTAPILPLLLKFALPNMVAMLATALLPTQAQAGAAAGWLLLALRCVMAFSVGGEYTGVVAYLLEGAVLTETIFAWPGLGSYITDALMANNMPAVMGGTVVVGVVYIGLNMLSDILYKLVDPRART